MKTVETLLPAGNIVEIKTLPDGRKVVVQEISEKIAETNILKESNVYLEDCMNYLILLFYKTETKYSCSRTKLAKLLSILAFKYARKNRRIFLGSIYRYPECGTAIKELSLYCPRDVYLASGYEDDKKVIPLDEMHWDIITPIEDKDFASLSSDIKKAIEDVFYNFGAYSQVQLGECLNPIVEYEGVCKPDGSINLNQIAKLGIHDLNDMGSNEVIDYIFAYWKFITSNIMQDIHLL